jgi:hypothetical protein
MCRALFIAEAVRRIATRYEKNAEQLHRYADFSFPTLWICV